MYVNMHSLRDYHCVIKSNEVKPKLPTLTGSEKAFYNWKEERELHPLSKVLKKLVRALKNRLFCHGGKHQSANTTS